MASATLPTGPRGGILIGNMRDLSENPLAFFTTCARQYGDFVPLRLSTRRGVFINHPELIESILVAHHRDFRKSLALQRSRFLLGNGLLTSEGEFWRRQRQLMQPAFHRDRIEGYGRIMVEHARRTTDSWMDGETRDIHEEMMHLTLAIVSKTLFNADVSDEADEVGDALATALDTFNDRVNAIFLLPMWVPTPVNLASRRAVRQLDRIIYGIIEGRRAGGEDPGDLLSMLLRAQAEDGERMTDRQLRDEAMTLFLAGHETTALALSWTFYLLSQHPEAEERLVAELRAVLGGREPEVGDLRRLEYTEMVAMESIRLYPPAWALGREAIRDVEIGGHHLPKGTIALMSQWVMHRDPRYFEDPGRFRPERWADGFARRIPRFAYFPFGGGPRHCIGSSFAMMEAVLLTASVAQRYHMELVPGQRIVPEPSITLRPAEGIEMVLRRRETPQP
jgi:cytochrome P450